MGQMHDYSHDGGRRFYCTYNLERYYLASHRWYSSDKFDDDSTLLIVHNNPKFHGENFTCDNFSSNEFCLYYKDDRDGMKNWMLYIHKQSNDDYFTPIFHRNKCSKFILERVDNEDSFLIKETRNNVYLYMNLAKPRDLNKDGCSFYVGASTERDKATKFKYIDIERLI